MTSSSRRLIELAHSFAAHGGVVDERVDTVILRGAFATAEEQAQWLALCEQLPAPFRELQIYDREIGGDLDPSEPFSSERWVRIPI